MSVYLHSEIFFLRLHLDFNRMLSNGATQLSYVCICPLLAAQQLYKRY